MKELKEIVPMATAKRNIIRQLNVIFSDVTFLF